MTDIDTKRIKAQHPGPNKDGWCRGEMLAKWPCETYRMASELEASRKVVADARTYRDAVVNERKWERDGEGPYSEEEAREFMLLASKRLLAQSTLFEGLRVMEEQR